MGGTGFAITASRGWVRRELSIEMGFVQHSSRGFRRGLALLGLVAASLSFGVATAAAASASCNAINANPTVHWTGSNAGAGNNTSYPIGSFAAGEYVTATFTDYGTTDQNDPDGMGDYVFLNRADMGNVYVYTSGRGGSAGPHTLTEPTEFLMQYGLFVSVQDAQGLISPENRVRFTSASPPAPAFKPSRRHAPRAHRHIVPSRPSYTTCSRPSPLQCVSGIHSVRGEASGRARSACLHVWAPPNSWTLNVV
jgi:hypothetical protein